MKRFYKQAAVQPADAAYHIVLDDRPVRTPARNPLEAAGRALAEAIAVEWNVQAEEIDPRSMPFTGLANAAIDRVAPDPAAFARSLATYGESDLLYYRAQGPAPLVRMQAEHWDPLLAWARRRFDVDFEVVSGIMHRPQPPRTVDQLARAIAAREPFELAALSPIVTISGSLIAGLALADGAADLDTAWAAATVDERFQTQHWGEDAEAAAALEARRRDFTAAYHFLQLLKRP